MFNILNLEEKSVIYDGALNKRKWAIVSNIRESGNPVAIAKESRIMGIIACCVLLACLNVRFLSQTLKLRTIICFLPFGVWVPDTWLFFPVSKTKEYLEDFFNLQNKRVFGQIFFPWLLQDKRVLSVSV